MRLVRPMDAVYLWGETRRSPAHVVALQIFRPPAGAGPELLDGLYRAMTDPAAPRAARATRAATKSTGSGVVSQLGGTVRALAATAVAAVRERPSAVPFSAPRTIFNGRVGTARRFAGESWPIDRLRDVAR